MTPEQTLDWLAEQHKSQCNEDRPVQEWIRSMKLLLPAPVPLTDGVTVPLEILESAEASLGSFCSDHGWSDMDMQNMDNLSAYIARHKAAHGTTKGQS